MAIHRLPRPRDPLQLGKLIVDIATGQVVDAVAMAAGVTTKLWEIADMVAVLENWEAQQVKLAA
jgi:hypothetical protein